MGEGTHGPEIKMTCRKCHANPVAAEGMCLPCLRDKLADDKERRRIEEQRQRQARRRQRDDGKAYIGSGWERALQGKRP